MGGDTINCADCREQCTKLELCRPCITDQSCAMCGSPILVHSGVRRELQVCAPCKLPKEKDPPLPEYN
jgi:hypothetical protein